MNELLPLWRAHDAWSEHFSDSDYVVTESVLRSALSNNEVSADAALATLLLAKVTRLEHAALPLRSDECRVLLERELWITDKDGEVVAPEPDHLVAGLLSLPPALLFQGSFEDTPPATVPLVLLSDDAGPCFVYFQRLAVAEQRVAQALSDALIPSTALRARGFDPTVVLPSFASLSFALGTHTSVTPSAEVQKAFATLLDYRISFLTGGPGTGKTTALAMMLESMGRDAASRGDTLSLALCAPTAKAAIRLREAISDLQSPEAAEGLRVDPLTGSVQRLLGMHEETMVHRRSLACDLLVVDEVSMLDLGLMEQVIAACSPTTHLLFVGDPDQLVSVQVGAVLRDIVRAAEGSSFATLVTKLTERRRFKEAIGALADAVATGSWPPVEAALADYASQGIRLVAGSDDVDDAVLAWATSLVRAASGTDKSAGAEQVFEVLRSTALLCATREGSGSVAWWREHIRQSLAADPSLSFSLSDRLPVGAPVLITRNENRRGVPLDENLSNGDIGCTVHYGDHPLVLFGTSDKQKVRRLAEVDHCELAWSMTIHKSQGSEYQHVIVSLPDRASRVVTRELLYTAVTRARESVTVIGTPAQIKAALATSVSRAGGLTERLLARAHATR